MSILLLYQPFEPLILRRHWKAYLIPEYIPPTPAVVHSIPLRSPPSGRDVHVGVYRLLSTILVHTIAIPCVHQVSIPVASSLPQTSYQGLFLFHRSSRQAIPAATERQQ